MRPDLEAGAKERAQEALTSQQAGDQGNHSLACSSDTGWDQQLSLSRKLLQMQNLSPS